MINIVAIKTTGPRFVTNKLFSVGDKLAKQLIDQGKARLATEDEIKAGRGMGTEAPEPKPELKQEPKKRGRKPKTESDSE